MASKLARRITLFKVPEHNAIADYFVVSTVTGKTHMDALEHYIRKELAARGVFAGRSVEGRESPAWRVVDSGFLVVHLMDESARERYRLEDLWTETKPITWKTRISLKKSKKI